MTFVKKTSAAYLSHTIATLSLSMSFSFVTEMMSQQIRVDENHLGENWFDILHAIS